MKANAKANLIEPLTEREEDVLALLVEGKTNREIADALVLSMNTVKWYNRQIYGKLGVENREGLAERVRELGLIETADIVPLPQHNLPFRLNKFIGRINEIEQLNNWLPNNRLITLTGAGGIGKTRLSLESGRTQLMNFPDGVWFVELAAIADPTLVPQAVASVLRIQEASGESMLTTLEEYLFDKSILLILDNCEHVIVAAAEFVEWLLQKGPRLHLLVTSREALNIPGEVIFQVPSLSLPGTVSSSPDASEAVQLFIERAITTLPTFQVTDENAQTVAQICQRLDGIPLPIELAASKVNVLTVEQIAAHLDNAFQILTGGSRTAHTRHQTLRATIDWSYRLLSEPEQRLLGWLSVFTGGWTLETAEDMCANAETTKGDILNLLTLLVNKSLVVVDHSQEDGIRYGLLETIRQYAQEKLAEHNESHAAHNAHSHWFLNFAEKAAKHLLGSKQLEWLSRLKVEHDNLRAALTWSIEQDDAPTALRLAGALSEFWRNHGYFQEGIRWCETVLALTYPENNELALAGRARVLIGYEKLVYIQGLVDYKSVYDEHIKICNEALNIFQRLNDQHHVIFVLQRLSHLSIIKGDRLNARQLLEKGLALSKEINYRWGISEFLCNLSRLSLLERDPINARPLMEQGLAIKREVGETWYFSACLYILGRLWFYQEGDLPQAKALFQEGLRRSENTEMRWELVIFFRKLADLLIWEGDFVAAESLLEKALSLARVWGQRKIIGLTLIEKGGWVYRKGKPREALAFYEESLELFQAVDDQPNIGWAMANMGIVYSHYGEIEKAAELLHQAYPLTELGKDKWDRSVTFLGLARLARLQGDFEQAMATHQRALTEIRCIPYWLESLEGLGYSAILQEQFERATWLIATAQSFREQLGMPLPPVLKPEYERNLLVIKDNLADERFTSVWEDGRKLTIDDGRNYFTTENWPDFIKLLPNN